MRSRLGVIVMASLLISVPASVEIGCIVFQDRDHRGSQWWMERNSFMQMGGREPVGATGMIAHYRPDWNDQVSSLRVLGGGCTLTLYEHAGTWGYGAQLRSEFSRTSLGKWNDRASWAVCSCIGPPQH
jgi:hypothetical protein